MCTWLILCQLVLNQLLYAVLRASVRLGTSLISCLVSANHAQQAGCLLVVVCRNARNAAQGRTLHLGARTALTVSLACTTTTSMRQHLARLARQAFSLRSIVRRARLYARSVHILLAVHNVCRAQLDRSIMTLMLLLLVSRALLAGSVLHREELSASSVLTGSCPRVARQPVTVSLTSLF